MMKRISYHLMKVPIYFFIFFVLCITCDQPSTGPGDSDIPVDYEIAMELNYYPGNEIIFYESYGLFSTTLFAHSPDGEIGSFHVSFSFDATIVEYESIFSEQALVETSQSPGTLDVRVSEIYTGIGDYLPLCTITWKGIKTGITPIDVTVLELRTPGDISITLPGDVGSTVTIVKQMGTIAFDSMNYIEQGTDFITTVTFDPEEKRISAYDLDIFYDPSKVVIDTTLGNNGVSTGADGFIDTVAVDNGVIHITGTDPVGAGPGTDLEFFIIHCIAFDSGRTVLGCGIHTLITTDDIYIKPTIRTNSISIFTDSQMPVVDVFLEPDLVVVYPGTPFVTSIVLDIEGYTLAAYGIDIYYDPAILELDLTQANGDGVETGEDGFLTVLNTLKPGAIQVAGFDLNGVDPKPHLELLKIYWNPVGVTDGSEIVLDVRTLADHSSMTIERVRSLNSIVIVPEPEK